MGGEVEGDKLVACECDQRMCAAKYCACEQMSYRNAAENKPEKQLEAARATARVAINHLQSVLNTQRTHHQQQAADSAARDWLLSIGSD